MTQTPGTLKILNAKEKTKRTKEWGSSHLLAPLNKNKQNSNTKFRENGSNRADGSHKWSISNIFNLRTSISYDTKRTVQLKLSHNKRLKRFSPRMVLPEH